MPREDAGPWIKKAAEDEAVVGLILAARTALAVAAYHLQQSTEKRLKGLLAAVGIRPPFTHDVLKLAQLVPGSILTDEMTESLDLITICASATRYPGAGGSAEAEMDEAALLLLVDHHRQVLEWVQECSDRLLDSP